MKKSSVLSGSELFKYRNPVFKTLPQRGGQKDFAPDGSWLQAKWLEAASNERKNLLKEQRVEKVGNLVFGNWNASEKLVELEKEMGKFWSQMGFVDNGRKCLYPEEALFLMESNALVVKNFEVPWSIEEAYSFMLDKDDYINLASYQVYAYLRRLGYVLLRFQESQQTTFYERKINLDQHLLSANKKKKKRRHAKEEYKKADENKKQKMDDTRCGTSAIDHQINRDMKAEEITNEMVSDSNPSSAFCQKSETDVEESTISKCGMDMSPCGRTFEPMPVSSETDEMRELSSWDFSLISFPDIGECSDNVFTCNIPDHTLLPKNVHLSENRVSFNLVEYKRSKQVLLGRKKKYEKDSEDDKKLEFSFPEFIHNKAKRTSAKNWKEYKLELQAGFERENSYENLCHGPAACLWEGEVTPLVLPEEASCTAAILKKLQIVETANIFQNDRKRHESDTMKDQGQAAKILYDMYLPDSNFRKSDPGTPEFRITVSLSRQNPPSLCDLEATLRPVTDNVPLLWAVVDYGDISFYQFNELVLPQDISLG